MATQKTLSIQQQGLIAAALVSAMLTLVPVVKLVLVPLDYLNTVLHEMSHAIVAVMTGGAVARIDIHANGSGVTYTIGGVNWLISCAGYLGASGLGAAMIFFARTPDKAQWVLRTLAVVVALGLLLWVRGDLIGASATLLWLGVLTVASLKLKGQAAVYLCQFLGIQQCVHAFGSLVDLVHITAGNSQFSDALALQKMTLVPAIVWALAWSAASLVLLGFTVLRVLKLKPGSPA